MSGNAACAGLVRGLGGITDARLFSHCYVGTKRLVEEYVDEMCAALQALVDAPAHEFSPVCCFRRLGARLRRQWC